MITPALSPSKFNVLQSTSNYSVLHRQMTKQANDLDTFY